MKFRKITQILKIKIILKNKSPVPTFLGNATGSTEVFLGLAVRP